MMVNIKVADSDKTVTNILSGEHEPCQYAGNW